MFHQFCSNFIPEAVVLKQSRGFGLCVVVFFYFKFLFLFKDNYKTKTSVPGKSKDLGRRYRISAQNLTVSVSFCVNRIENLLHSP